jgi:hypothetical protein
MYKNQERRVVFEVSQYANAKFLKALIMSLPDDAMIAGVKMHEFDRKTGILVESVAFPVVPEGCMYPQVQVIVIREKSGKETMHYTIDNVRYEYVLEEGALVNKESKAPHPACDMRQTDEICMRCAAVGTDSCK